MKYIEVNHSKKHYVIIFFICLFFSIICSRLVQLQVIQHQRFVSISEKNFLRFKTIPAPRGNILDCNGAPLATNQPVTRLIWQGTGNHSLQNKQKEILQKISSILDIDLPERAIRHAEKFSKTAVIAEKISSNELCFIAEQCSDIPNITFETSFERFYPYNTLACHILGYLGDAHIITQGKMGLEKLFEDVLKGEPGIYSQQINSFGTPLESKIVKTQLSGQDIVTTIDLPLQKIAEQAMKTQQKGTLILFNPQTGRIPALVSLPNFEPSILSQKLSHQQWQEIQKNKPFINKAFNASYPPASIFKLVTIAAALEEELETCDSEFTCKGYTKFKNRKYFCNKHSGHGPISLHECLAFSCNIPCYDIAKKIPIDTLASYAYKLGLGNKTDAIFTEKYGLIPTNEWKIANKGERWWQGETLSASIGQSFLLTTPIQIACMISAIFEGYLVKPRILNTQEITKTPLEGISNETLEFLKQCMKSVITTGTGKRINKFSSLTIFAKTGTAQTIGREKRQRSDSNHKEHAWFVSYFYTNESTPLVLVILLENVGGSRTAANVAKEFFTQYTKLIEKG